MRKGLYLFIFTSNLQEFKEQCEENAGKIEYITTAGRYFLQKSESHDAVIVQRELDKFHDFCSEVLARLEKFQKRVYKAQASQVSKLLFFLLLSCAINIIFLY